MHPHPKTALRRGAARLALALATLAPAATAAVAQGPGGGADVDDLAQRISAVIDRAPFDRAHWGILIQDARSGQVLYERNADRLFVPASNMKLVVAAASAHLLPADFRFRTSLYATAPVRDGVLEGDLVLYGRGDPAISGRFHGDRMLAVWEALADSVAAAGIRRVEGGIVADESRLDSLHRHQDWENYDLLWWYAAPVGALGFNDNSIDFHIRPGAVGEPARIEWQPRSDYVTVLNRTRTVGSGGARTLDFTRVGDSDTVLAYGTIPADARPWTEYFAVRDAALYAGTVFREVLESRGVEVARRDVRVVRAERESVVDAAGAIRGGAREIARWASVPLPDLIFPILNSSQNWFAEQMLKTLGREIEGVGSWDTGLAVERAFLTDVVGLEPETFHLRDASGLSGGNLITPRALARLLEWSRTRNAVVDAMPVSGGTRGSLRSRLTDLQGRVRAKTGGIRNVDSLSGYVTTEDGRELIFVVIANGSAFSGARARAAIDDVVRAAAALD